MPSEFVRGRVSQLRNYIFKSASPLETMQDGIMTVELPEMRLTKSGLETKEGLPSHLFMFVSSHTLDGIYRKITQRDRRGPADRSQGLADLVNIKPQFIDGNLYLTWNHRDPILVPLDNDNGKAIPVEIWEEDGIFQAVDQGDEIAQWVSDEAHLNYPTRVVKAAGPFERQARQNYMPNDNQLFFQDGYPGHWFSEEDVAELNRRAKKLSEESNGRIPYVETIWQQFRPQILIEGYPAQFIHTILTAAIGETLVANPKPCGRCPVTSINPNSGQFNGLNPNTVLGTYQVWKDAKGKNVTIFGENLVTLEKGTIRVGDQVEHLNLRNPAPKIGSIKDVK